MANKLRPPRFLVWVLFRVLPRYVDSSAIGDFEEEYAYIMSERSKTFANFWLLLQILKSVPSFIVDTIRFWAVMLKNYTIIAWRDLKKNKLYSFINLSGLAIGMACCIVIILFIQDELSFDKFNKNAGRIYRVTMSGMTPGGEMYWPYTLALTGPGLKDDFPEIEEFVRIVMHRRFIVEYMGKRVFTDPAYADPSIFKIFTFPLIQGDENTVLDNPSSVVLSVDLAEKLFGSEDPLGKIIAIYDTRGRFELQVTGIMKNIPHNSHMRFDFLASFQHLVNILPGREESRISCFTYILLNPQSDPSYLEAKFPVFLEKYYGERMANLRPHHLQKLTSIHLHAPESVLDFSENSRLGLSYSLSVLVLIVLLVAAFNYINLSTARASRRAHEVGMRKVIGAGRIQLVRQFLGESIVMSFIALLFSIILAALILPIFNGLMGRHLRLDFGSNLFILIELFVLALVVGFFSSLYPAVFLSSYRPAQVLKGTSLRPARAGSLLRKILVVSQFALSLIFIIGSVVIFMQIRYIGLKDLGFEKENVIEIPIFKDSSLGTKSDLIVREMSAHPNVMRVIVSAGAPGGYNGYTVPCIPEGATEDNSVEVNILRVGKDYFDFFGIEILQGRDFSPNISTDAQTSVIINETAAKTLGWDYPIGKTIRGEGLLRFFDTENPLTVIGVVKDFHNGSLHEEIPPSIYQFQPESANTVFIRIRPENVQETLSFLAKKWQELPTHLIFSYSFLSDQLENLLYVGEKNLFRIFNFASILTILLASMGLFGLAAFTADRRKKEIGLRKVLGASESKIILMLSKEFSWLILIANLVAWPVAYFIASRWLQNFAYRISIDWWVFFLAAVFVSVVTFVTISLQSYKAAIMNPADTLRYE